MTETSAKVILDSVSAIDGARLTTMEVTLHRFVLAELNTHRAFARNSASSRAIPVEKMLERFVADMAWPLEWPREQPGMQGGSELEGDDLQDAEELFQNIHNATALLIKDYLDKHPKKSTRLHKSVLNRPMEWGQWHKVIVSSTEWENFFEQRCSPLAQPEIRVAAEKMREAMEQSVPTRLGYGEWHTPLILPEERESYDLHTRMKMSVARCARVSYDKHDDDPDFEADMRLWKRLTDNGHNSPLEHVATPLPDPRFLDDEAVETNAYSLSSLGNFDGWAQLRHNLAVLA